MKRSIITHGLTAGIIVSTFMLLSINYLSHREGGVGYGASLLIGYASMLLAFSLVFFGIRKYRDKFHDGVINFGGAFKAGLFMVLIASTVYVIAWLIDYFFFFPDYMERFSARMLEDLKAGGASQAEIDKQIQEMASMAAMYKNPFFNAMMTYMEILPVGLVVTLISAFILRRKPIN